MTMKNLAVLLLLFSGTTFAKCVIEEKTLAMGDTVEQVKYEVCDDKVGVDPYAVGFISDLFVFRQHPDKKGTFSMNGTVCKWFIDTKNTIELKEFEGVICHIGSNKWQVVDKF